MKASSQTPCTLSSIIKLVKRELGLNTCLGKITLRTTWSVLISKITIFGGQTLVKSSKDVIIPESNTYKISFEQQCLFLNYKNTQSLLQESFLILYTEVKPSQLSFCPFPIAWNPQLGYASNAGPDPRGLFLGMVSNVAGAPERSRGMAKKYRSSVISRPVKIVFSGLKQIEFCMR